MKNDKKNYQTSDKKVWWNMKKHAINNDTKKNISHSQQTSRNLEKYI